MLHVRESDNGPYTIKVSGPSGYTETRDLMLEVMTEYRDEKWTKWMQNVEADRYASPHISVGNGLNAVSEGWQG